VVIALIAALGAIASVLAPILLKKKSAIAHKRLLQSLEDCQTLLLIEKEYGELLKLYSPERKTLKNTARNNVRKVHARELSAQCSPAMLQRKIEQIKENLRELEK
jgi:hypothetical protein